MIYLQVLPKQVTLHLVFAYLSSKNPPLFLGPCYDSIAAYVFTDNYFLFTSMLVDALRSMDVSRYPDSLTLYPRLPYHAPPARVLICFLSVLRVSSYSYRYGLSTRLRLLACLPFPFLCCRLVSVYRYRLRFSFCSLSTHLAFCYSWILTRLWLVSPLRMFVLVSRRPLYIWVGDVGLFPIFNLLCNHPKGVTCEIPRTLLVLSSPLAKATAL